MANLTVTTMHYTMALRDVRLHAGEPWQGPDEIVRASTMVEIFLNMDLARASTMVEIFLNMDLAYEAGEEYRYERSRERTSTEITENKTAVDAKQKPKSHTELKSLISNAASQNKAWLMMAMGCMHPKKGGASSSHAESTPTVSKEDLMKAMQEAWDASTTLTSDAGLLAQKVLRDSGESVASHNKASKIMALLVKCTGPGQQLLAFLGHTCEQIDPRAAQKALHACAEPFCELEKAHQLLLEETAVLTKKERKLALEKLEGQK